MKIGFGIVRQTPEWT